MPLTQWFERVAGAVSGAAAKLLKARKILFFDPVYFDTDDVPDVTVQGTTADPGIGTGYTRVRARAGTPGRAITFELDYTALQALAPGVKTASFTIKAAAAIPPGQVVKLFSESQFSPNTPWVAFDDGSDATYSVEAGNASLPNGLISNWDVANGSGATGIVSVALGDYTDGDALLPSPAEDLTLNITSSADLNTAIQGHLSVVIWIGNALPV